MTNKIKQLEYDSKNLSSLIANVIPYQRIKFATNKMTILRAQIGDWLSIDAQRTENNEYSVAISQNKNEKQLQQKMYNLLPTIRQQKGFESISKNDLEIMSVWESTGNQPILQDTISLKNTFLKTSNDIQMFKNDGTTIILLDTTNSTKQCKKLKFKSKEHAVNEIELKDAPDKNNETNTNTRNKNKKANTNNENINNKSNQKKK
eukprot:282304_1